MQVIGLCRFSYLATGGFRGVQSHALFDRTRLEERFAHFETLTLPSLRAQSDPDFDFVIVTSADLPAWALERLFAAAQSLPSAVIEQHGPGRMMPLMRAVAQRARRDPSAPCLQFRQDDDDAVATDFIARLREAARLASDLCAAHPMVGVDWTSGFAIQCNHLGVSGHAQHKPNLGVAHAVHVLGGIKASIFHYPHHKLSEHVPTLSFPDPPMWLRAHGDFNDSGQTRARVPNTPLAGATLKRFGISPESVAAAFSAL